MPSCLCRTRVCVHVLRVRSSAVRGAVRGTEQSPSSPGTSRHRVAVSCPSPQGGAVPCRGAGSVAMLWVRGLGLCQDQGWCPEPPQPCPAWAPRGLRPQRCSGAAARPCCRAGREVQPFLLVLLRKHCKGSPQNHFPHVLCQRVCGWGSPAVRGVLREAESPPPATGTWCSCACTMPGSRLLPSPWLQRAVGRQFWLELRSQ